MKTLLKITAVITPALILAALLFSPLKSEAGKEQTSTSSSYQSSVIAMNAMDATTVKGDITFEKDTIQIKRQNGDTLTFDVELATTPKQRAQGLMFRRELADNEGMLFIFEDEYRRAFWMKNTFIPLDMLFTYADGRIHHIHHNARPQSLTQISSEFPSFAVLEIPGGLSGRIGIEEGDQILHPAFKNVAE